MPSRNLPLRRLEGFLQAVIEHPGSTEAAVRSPRARRELGTRRLEQVVLPSRSLSATERIGVYHDMYLLRLGDALATDYPATAALLGPHRFRAIARAYLIRHPSTTYTLNRLGDHFPAFLARQRRLPRATFVRDLARLELAVSQVFDETEQLPLSAAALAAIPAESWPDRRLTLLPALRIVEVSWDLVDAYQALRQEERPPAVRRRRAWVAIYRRQDAVKHVSLAPAEAALVKFLLAGRTLGQAIAAISRHSQLGRDVEKQVGTWFRDLTARGWIVRVSTLRRRAR